MGDERRKTGAEAFSDAGVGRRKATRTEGGSGPAIPAIDPGDGDELVLSEIEDEVQVKTQFAVLWRLSNLVGDEEWTEEELDLSTVVNDVMIRYVNFILGGDKRHWESSAILGI
ncbi:hypothetical protein MRB53_031821 [Persea americana]|uniref:Uncharacterized protein n=1 Tax=Persea americana TaxID=3435 RepID=A0ACC2KQ68_PERAE|nr:hypothetical protein MRB53_031821 [Persea americana]